MATIALISLYDGTALGIRALSAMLRGQGHRVYVIYLKEYEVIMKSDFPPEPVLEEINLGLCSQGEVAYDYPRHISEREWALLSEFLHSRSIELVGISLTSKFVNTAREVTRRVHRQGLTVIWGGVEPTINPAGSIEYADYVCVGEGEGAMTDFARAWDDDGDLTGIPNIWARRGEQVFRNDPRPLIQDLDSLPFPDFSPDDKYEISRDEIRPRIQQDCGQELLVMTARGCPNQCTYCVHNLLRLVYPNQRYVRRMSVDRALAMLRDMVARYDIRRIFLFDDIFTMDKNWLREFLPRYRQEINLPYWAYVSPRHCDAEICQLLKVGGPVEVRMGVQSGSERVLRELYHRNTTREQILTAAGNLHDAGIPFAIDVITSNPLETEQDCRDTLELLLAMPAPVQIGSDTLSYLSFFPNYQITECYQNHGSPELDASRYAFYNRLYLLAQYRPGRLVRWLSHSRYYRRHPERLQAFFPGQGPTWYQALQRLVPQRVRDLAKNVLGTVLGLRGRGSSANHPA